MAYLSLYRRHRPLKFADMIGQEHITRTLSNALCNDRLAHAYLFCGPRGTGKTTAAKILSRTMNCELYPVAEPCGKCGPCKNIAAGVSIDVIEMDAASNRGIDEIRELRERSRFASGESRYKVYIIDEAHMLTPEACNAFLKTLEEPPQSVVFILATTDPSRLPSTIVSRCQRFDFHLLTVNQIKQHLEDILDQENWQADSEAVALIARLADGSLRDALGILEQCSAYGEEKIDAVQVRIITGATMADSIETLVKSALDNNLESGLSVLEEVVFSGRDLNLFMRDLIFIFTCLLLDSGSAQKQSAISMHGFDNIVSQYRGKVERNLLLDAVELLHEVSAELRNAHFPHYILEVAFIRLIRLLHGRLKPISVLHSSAVTGPDVEEVSITQDLKTEAGPKTDKTAAEKRETKLSKNPEDSITLGDTNKDKETDLISFKTEEKVPVKDRTMQLKSAWPQLLQEIKRRQKSTAAWLEPAVPVECRGNRVRLVYSQEYTIHQIRIMEDNHRKTTEDVLSAFCGEKINIKADVTAEGAEADNISEEKTDDYSAISDPAAEKTSHSAPEPSADPSFSQKKEEPVKKKAPGAEEAMELFGGKIIDSD